MGGVKGLGMRYVFVNLVFVLVCFLVMPLFLGCGTSGGGATATTTTSTTTSTQDDGEGNLTNDDTVSITITTEAPSNSDVVAMYNSCLEDLAGEAVYNNGYLPTPEAVFLSNGTVETFAFVSVPDTTEAVTKAFVHIHGHAARCTVTMDPWHIQTHPRNIAIIAIQYWLETDQAPSGYALIDEEGTTGYYIKIRSDMYPFINALLQNYNISSALLHGFSMGAYRAAVSTYYDRVDNNLVDLCVFNAGSMIETSSFREAVVDNGDQTLFNGEQYTYFIEDFYNGTHTEDAMNFIVEYGGQTVNEYHAEEGNNYNHGCLMNHNNFLTTRSAIIEYFESL